MDFFHLGPMNDQIISKINNKTAAVFLSHIQGFNALSTKLYNILKKKKIPLIEDVCESHGAKFKKKKKFHLSKMFASLTVQNLKIKNLDPLV